MKRLTIAAAARRLGVHVEQLVREVYFGELVAHVSTNRRVYFLERDLRAWRARR